MGGFSLTHWIIVGLVLVVLFGRGRISALMGDVGSGIRSFRRELAENDPRRFPTPEDDAVLDVAADRNETGS